MLEIVLNNKEWIFSGIGVTTLGLVATMIFRRKPTKVQHVENVHSSESVTVVQASDQAQVNLTTKENHHPAQVHVVDVKVVEEGDCAQALDIKLRNSGNEVAYVTGVELTTLKHWQILSDAHPQMRPVSAVYDMSVAADVNSTTQFSVSHEIKPQETDRIQVNLSTEFDGDPLGLSLFLLGGCVRYNEDAVKAVFPHVLMDIHPPSIIAGSYFGGYAKGTMAKNKQVALEILELPLSTFAVQEGVVEALQSWRDAPSEDEI